MIRFACPRCKIVLQAPDGQAGSKVACPKCQQRLQIPIPPPPVNKTVLAPFLGHGPNPCIRQPNQPASKADPNWRTQPPQVLSRRDLVANVDVEPINAPVAEFAQDPASLDGPANYRRPSRRLWFGLVALLPALTIAGLFAFWIFSNHVRSPEQADEKRSQSQTNEEELVRRYVLNNSGAKPEQVEFVEWGPHMTWQEVRDLFDEAGIHPQQQGYQLVGGPATPAASVFCAAFVSDVFSGNRGIALVRVAYRAPNPLRRNLPPERRSLTKESKEKPNPVPDSRELYQFLYLVEGKQVVLLQTGGDGLRMALLGDAIGITDAGSDWKKQWRINLARTFPAINVDR